MGLISASVLAAALVSVHQAGDLTLPADLKGAVGDFVIVKADTRGETVRWVLMDAGPSLLPAELLRDSKTAVFFSLRPGRFRLLAYTAVGNTPSTPAICSIVIGDAGPTPPPPGPPPPGPIDPMAARFQAAYAASTDPAATKAKQRDLLIGLYQAMATHANDPAITTTADLLSDLRKTADQLIMRDVCLELRKVIAAEIGATIGDQPNLVFDAARRKQAVEVFTRIHKALENLK